MSERKKPHFWLRALVIFIVAVIVIVTVKLVYDNNELLKKVSQLEAELKEEQLKLEELQNKNDTPFDEDYAEDVARDKLGLKKQDEVIYYNDLPNS